MSKRVPTKSARWDGLGHWPAGKPRSTLTVHERATVVRQLQALVDLHGSMRAAARAIDVSDRTVRRILSGEDQPSKVIQAKLRG